MPSPYGTPCHGMWKWPLLSREPGWYGIVRLGLRSQIPIQLWIFTRWRVGGSVAIVKPLLKYLKCLENHVPVAVR